MFSTFDFEKNKIIKVVVINKPTICNTIACILSHPLIIFLILSDYHLAKMHYQY